MSPSNLRSVAATALAAKSALWRFRDAANEVWPGMPPINPHIFEALTGIALWAEKGGRAKPELAGLRGLFLDPIVQAPPQPAPPPLAEASVAAVMGQLGTKGGASKSPRKLAAANATLAKIRAARALQQAMVGNKPLP